VAQTVTIGEQKVYLESESLKFSATPTPQVENPSDFSTPTPQPWLKPTRYTISKLQTLFKFNHASSNQRRRYSDSHTWGGCFANTLLPGSSLTNQATMSVLCSLSRELFRSVKQLVIQQ